MIPGAISADLAEQLDYYRARAREYDEWWLRRGRYDRGPALNREWFSDSEILYSALEAFRPRGRVLELACGTGIWTQRLLPFASELTALDGASEMLAINAVRVGSAADSRPRASEERPHASGRPTLRHLQADLFQWEPDALFDTVFFGFWLSHVPPERFAAFWDLVRRCLAPGGRVFFVDSAYESSSTAVDHRLPAAETYVSRRRLNDGREFDIYKVFYEPRELAVRLRELGWRLDVHRTPRCFIYGHGSRAGA